MQSKIISRGGLIGLVLAITLLFTGCPGSQKHIPQTILIYAISTDVISLDPVRVTEDSPRLISSQILETLTTYDAKLQLQPLLAESWESLEDGRKWRFRLRSNILFHEDPAFQGKSRAVTAADVVYSLNRLLDSKTQTLGAFILTDVVEGAAAFLEGKATTVSGITAEDERSVLFRLTKPYAYFPARLSLPFAAIIPREAVDYYGDRWGTHPVGTGPFQFKSWDVATGEIVLDRNPRYWRQIPTNLTGLRFRILKAEATQLAEFAQGKLDALELTPAIAPQVLTADGKLIDRFREAQVLQTPVLVVHFIGFNFRNRVLQDRNVRLAFNYAVDKEQLTKQVLNGLTRPATGPLVSPLPGAEDTPLYPQDIERAKALLKRSTYRGQEFTYMTDNSTESVAVAEFLHRQLGAMGIKIRIDKNPESVWLDKLSKGQFELAKLYFAFDYPSPDNGLSQFLKANFAPAGPNFLHYTNGAFDLLYDQGLREGDPAKAARLYGQMNQMIRDEAPWLFLFYPTRTVLVQKGVQDLKINALSFSLILTETKKRSP
jgi:ABC-type transport system substrate-binding protein